MLWIVAMVLIIAWLIGLLTHQGGFIHILLLCGLAIALVQFIAGRRAVG